MEVQCSFEGLLRVLQVYTAIRVLSDRLQFQIGEIECNKDLQEVEFFVCGSTPLPHALKQARQQVFAP
jgi:hypothetical protein